MKLICQFFCLSLLSTFCITNSINPVLSQCLEDQKLLLLSLKSSLIFDFSTSKKLVRWNQTVDCCIWDGVECDVSGHVIGLQLDEEMISSGIENSGILFSLGHLEKLNLAFNNFDNIEIPKGLYNLKNLTYLNLSNAGFAGQVPSEISRMKSLVSLDLSGLYPGESLKLENPNLKMLVQNLTGLRELYLNSVNISAHENDWCQVLSSSLPDLRVLSLRDCSLSGPIDSSLTKLRSLSVLHLDGNNLSSEVPNFFANFSKLTTLGLGSCSLLGSFPEEIFLMPTLQNLQISYNMLLSGNLPQFPLDRSLRTIALSYTNFSGSLPGSIGNLAKLSSLELSNCSFKGRIPPSIENLTELVYFDISFNNFTGSLPLFRMSKKLTYIDAYRNRLTGSLSSMHFEGLSDLVHIVLGHNLLRGNIPSSLFDLPSLRTLQLSNNEFHGRVQEFFNPSSSSLAVLDLSSNHLEGPIPKFFSQLEGLKALSLSSNSFNGTVQLDMFNQLNLARLELSHNDLVVHSTRSNSSVTLFSRMYVVGLASCKLQSFPEVLRESTLSKLDLSSNQLKGEIPNWIWDIGNGSLTHVNLSFNLLNGFQKPYKFPSLLLLDLHSNQFQGELPNPPLFSVYVDYSFNNFSNSIPNDIGNFISVASFFSVSNNKLTGGIPTSICNATYLIVLDLSANALTGGIPACLPRKIRYLGVLSLSRNNLSGSIPDTFAVDCSLKTLDLNKNVLEGKIPESLDNCRSVEVLNIGNNRIEDTFPCMLMKTSLRVLILRSNKFYGDLQCLGAVEDWSNLQIIDISTNNFSGDISNLSISNWRGMIDTDEKSQYNHLRFDFLQLNDFYYQDAVTVTMKGLEMELTKILIVFTSIDLSSNKFHGKIPRAIGDLKSLYLLNLSHNSITGAIPGSIGNLTQLGSLDLSVNQLTGIIPIELAGLTFISFLNLSFNKLVGMIPKGPQFQTFSADSYVGNSGLCGFPVDRSCKNETSGDSPTRFHDGLLYLKKEIEWEYVSAALGYAVGLASFVWLLLHCDKWRKLYFEQVDNILVKVFPSKDDRRSRRGRVIVNQVGRR